MIKHLYIKDFILIDEIELDFSEGFSCFIGETGAGKSILIDAISLLRAERASSSLVAKGKSKAIVEGTFDLADDRHAMEVLKEAGFETEGEVTFTREIAANGKSTARIDHRIATLSLMKDILRDQLDIHGQRESQYLLNEGRHIHLLDEYLQDQSDLQTVSDSYRSWKKLCDERDAALKNTYNENDLEYFQYEVKEIEDADLKEGEDEELESKEKQYKAVRASFEKLNQLLEAYDDHISSDLDEMNRMVQSLNDNDALADARNTVNDSCYAIQDAMDTIRKSLDDMNLSEDEINEMEERLFTIQKMKRKYGRTISDILAKKEELQKQIDMIANRQSYLNEINQKIDTAFQAYRQAADHLSKIRHAGVSRLDQAVNQSLKDLVLPNARFHVSIMEGKPSSLGSDKVQFLVSMNKGEDLKPLAETASGGELSRLMLGLKEIFTKLEGIHTVIFDEIDTGVSGPVATAIGKKMRRIAQDCQVFAVTHLAPVAACSSHVYFVSKSEKDGRTHTNVHELNHKEIIHQLALISSGEATTSSLAAAEELYRRNQK